MRKICTRGISAERAMRKIYASGISAERAMRKICTSGISAARAMSKIYTSGISAERAMRKFYLSLPFRQTAPLFIYISTRKPLRIFFKSRTLRNSCQQRTRLQYSLTHLYRSLVFITVIYWRY
jgi:hypothetical protein